MKISELAGATGVSSHRLRHYEKVGLISAARTDSGYRHYPRTAVREVIFIAKCREVGISLKEIGEVLPGYRVGTLTFDDMIELMSRQIRQVDKQLAELSVVRDDLTAALKWFQRKKREQQSARRQKLSSPTGQGANQCQIRNQ